MKAPPLAVCALSALRTHSVSSVQPGKRRAPEPDLRSSLQLGKKWIPAGYKLPDPRYVVIAAKLRQE